MRLALVSGVLIGAAGASGQLIGTTMDVALDHGASIVFTHTYGTPQVVDNPFFAGTSFGVTSPAGFAGFHNSILLDFTNFAYSDYPGGTGTITITGIAEDPMPNSAALFNGAGVQIGSASTGPFMLIGQWAVDAVPGTDPQPRVYLAWNSVPTPGAAAVLAGAGLCLCRRRR